MAMHFKSQFRVLTRKSFQYTAAALFLIFVLFIGWEVSLYKLHPWTYFPVDILDGNPKNYYVNLAKKYTEKSLVFHDDAVPLFPIPRSSHPVYIAQYALGAYEVYLKSGDTLAKQSFIRCADWLLSNLKKFQGFDYWLYDIPIDYPDGLYGIPWPSAMAQGEGVSVLVRAYCETRDEKYLQAAQRALEPVLHDISKGGCSVVIGNNHIFPQEYITREKPPNILNGAIFSFFGLYDLYRVTKSVRYEQYCKIMVDSFAEKLPLYDTGFWSYYDLNPIPPSRIFGGNLASRTYHALHIVQLKVLYDISGRMEFLQYADKFKEYEKSWLCRIQAVLLTHWQQLMRAETGDFKKISKFLKEL